MASLLKNAQLLNPGRGATLQLGELNGILERRRSRLAGAKSAPGLSQARERPGTAPAQAGRAAPAAKAQSRPESARVLKKKPKKPVVLTDDDLPPKPGQAWVDAAKNDPVALEVCAQLDECALIKWKAELDLKEKRDFFGELHTGCEHSAKHFEERADAAVKETNAAATELTQVTAARLAAQKEHAVTMAGLQRQLDEVNARNAVHVERRLRESDEGRQRRRAAAAQTQTWQNDMLAENMKKTRAKKQMGKQRKLTADALREAEDKKRFVEQARQDTAGDTARLKRLEEELAALTKANLQAAVKAKKAAEAAAEEG